MLPGLIVGRIVHYVLGASDLPSTHQNCVGQIIPAIVVNTWVGLGREDGYCNLTGFPDWSNQGLAGSVWLTSRVNDETKKQGTWHWPQSNLVKTVDKPNVAEELIKEPVSTPSTTAVVEFPPPAPDAPAIATGIEPGATVVLRSGGPRMTVANLIADGATAACSWFDSTGQVSHGNFPVNALDFIQPDLPGNPPDTERGSAPASGDSLGTGEPIVLKPGDTSDGRQGDNPPVKPASTDTVSEIPTDTTKANESAALDAMQNQTSGGNSELAQGADSAVVTKSEEKPPVETARKADDKPPAASESTQTTSGDQSVVQNSEPAKSDAVAENQATIEKPPADDKPPA